MIIHLSKEENISFILQLEGLKEAIKHCNLGSGTIYNPINIDGFVTPTRHDLPTIYPGATLEMTIEEDEDSATDIALTSGVMENVGKVFNEGAEYPINKWEEIFDIRGKDYIKSLPNGSLCIAPTGNTISISVLDNGQSPPDELHYIAYNITLEIELRSRIWYFEIDPLLKISSNPPLD